MARQILDSRGNPTVEVEVVLDDGSLGRAGVPSGASTGAFEAVELRDGGSEYGGKGGDAEPSTGCSDDEFLDAILGHEADDQRLVDQALIDLDGTPGKSRIGANAIIGVSMAVARAAADSANLQLFRYLGGPNAHLLPVPMLNILNGGAHADNNVDIQEFMIAPIGARDILRGAALGRGDVPRAEVGAQAAGLSTGVGDEGGFAPDLDTTRPRSTSSWRRSGRPGSPPAGTSRSRWTWRRPNCTPTAHTSSRAGSSRRRSCPPPTSSGSAAYPLVSIEDPLSEEDWAGWQR